MSDTETGEAETGEALAGTKRLVEAVRRRYPITDERLISALATVDRRFFLEDSPGADPYADRSYSIRRAADGTRLSSSTAPSLSAFMIQALRLEPGNSVLEIGAATGYNAALLSRVVGPVRVGGVGGH
jgi:protein-L-isoaspartate(D-aspartate) O-methyltransferase